MDAAEEHELIRKAKQGDQNAFEALYNLHKPQIYSVCLRMTANPLDAEDLTQETFLQIYRKIGTFKGNSKLSTWCYRVAANFGLMRARKKKIPSVSLDGPFDRSDERNLIEVTAQCDPKLQGTVERLTLIRALLELPQGYKTIFILHEIEGYEHNEIARILGCSIGNSKSQLHKAKARLRMGLAGLSASR